MLKDKYKKESDKSDKNKDKIKLSDDAYAICEMLERICIRLR